MHDGDESLYELLDLVLLNLVPGEDKAETKINKPDCLIVADCFLISGVSFLLGEQEVLEDWVDVDMASDCL